jgi:AraC-like DNA-binding protein
LRAADEGQGQDVLEGRQPVGEIATIVGYADPAILTRAFTRWVGATPGDWRLTSAAD